MSEDQLQVSGVVIVYPTIMSGTVVRWYRDLTAAEIGHEWASAGRDGVTVTMAPRRVAEVAYDVHERLKADSSADVSDVVTHTKSFLGSIRPVPSAVGEG